MTTNNNLEIKVQKGLGVKLGESITSLGRIVQHRKYANLVTDGKEFNVMVMDNTSFEPHLIGGAPNFREFYLFPRMVSEEEAMARYDSLR